MTKNRISLIALVLILISLILNNSDASHSVKMTFNNLSFIFFIVLIILLIVLSIRGKRE